jgi:hypothetical protein
MRTVTAMLLVGVSTIAIAHAGDQASISPRVRATTRVAARSASPSFLQKMNRLVGGTLYRALKGRARTNERRDSATAKMTSGLRSPGSLW